MVKARISGDINVSQCPLKSWWHGSVCVCVCVCVQETGSTACCCAPLSPDKWTDYLWEAGGGGVSGTGRCQSTWRDREKRVTAAQDWNSWISFWPVSMCKVKETCLLSWYSFLSCLSELITTDRFSSAADFKIGGMLIFCCLLTVTDSPPSSTIVKMMNSCFRVQSWPLRFWVQLTQEGLVLQQN